MWAANVSREDFLGIIQGELPRHFKPILIESVEHSLDASGIGLLWVNDPSDYPFPSVALIPDEKQNDFLAWVASFLSGVRPFTAFCRVTDLPAARALTRPSKIPRLNQRTLSALVGAVVGEATVYTRGARLERSVAFKACTSTLSFAVLKAYSLGLEVDVKYTARLWSLARKLTKQQGLPVESNEVHAPLEGILAVLDGSRLRYAKEIEGLPQVLSELFFDYANAGVVSDDALSSFGQRFGNLEDVVPHMRDPREERIQYLEHALRQLASIRDRQAASFAAGLLTSQVAPGTFEHLKLLQQHAASLPLAFMWYAVFAGLHDKSTLLNFADGVGRRLVQEITRRESILDTPRCDVSIAELQVLSREASELDLRTSGTAHIEVEILPCVVSSMRASARGADSTQGQLFRTAATNDDIADWVDDMDGAVDRLMKTQERLHRILGTQGKKGKRKF
jgi:hypothetical protein